MKNRIGKIAAAAVLGLALTGCGATSYDFETEPLDNMEGDTDSGWTGNPKDVQCVQIEADGPTDERDVQMGTFCKDGSAPSSSTDDDAQGDEFEEDN